MSGGGWVGGCGVSNLNLSCDRPLLELLKECFSFKIDSSKLKLRAVKEIAANRTSANTCAPVHR